MEGSMLSDRELSPDEIAELTSPKASSSSYVVPGTNVRKKYNSEIRTVTNWFKLPLTMTGYCDVEHHDEERESREAPRMFFVLDGVKMCRWCFIEGRDKL
jgi:hypothetical protein